MLHLLKLSTGYNTQLPYSILTKAVQSVLIPGCLRTEVAINSVSGGFDHLHSHPLFEHTDIRQSKTPYTMKPSSL